MDYVLNILFLLLIISSCAKAPEYSDIPEIEFLEWTRDTLVQGTFNQDSTYVRFSFTDGDGDLGSADEVNIFIRDIRQDSAFQNLRLPAIPQDGVSNGISGTISGKIYQTCCVYDNGQQPCTPSLSQPLDSVRYEIYIEDNAGHESNVILTDALYLRCL